MIEPMKREAVTVNRHGMTFQAETTHTLWGEVTDDNGKFLRKGDLLGVGIEVVNGHGAVFGLYAQPSMLQVA